MPERLLHRNRCAESISWVNWPYLTTRSMIPLAYRSRSLWCKVVDERLPEAGRSGLSGKPDAAELRLELHRHVAVGRGGRAETVRRAVECVCMSGDGVVPKPRTRE